jgi:predicted acyltransferase
MLIVNNPGSWSQIYSPLKHAKWNGCTLADLVFPFFIFIMGVSIPFSFKNFNLKKILLRSFFLITMGFFLNLIPNFDFEKLRILGVLQRLGLVYFFSSLLFLVPFKNFKNKLIYLLFCFVLFLLIHSFILKIPNYEDIQFNLEIHKNIAGYLDRKIFGENHLWEYSKTWDPEGILGTISSISSCMIGVFIGCFILNTKINLYELLLTLSISYLFFILHFFLIPILPINKNLWTASYVIFTSSISISIFILFFYYETKISRLYNSILILGKHSIFLYILSSVLAKLMNLPWINSGGKTISLKSFIYKNCFSNTYFSSLSYSIYFLLLCILICYIYDYYLKVKNPKSS